MLPRVAAVGRLQDAVARVAVPGHRALAGADIDDVVVRGGDHDGARRQRRQVVGARDPGVAAGVHRPDSALSRAQDESPVLADRQRADTPVDGGERTIAALDLDDRARPNPGPGRLERDRAGRNGLLPDLGCLVGAGGSQLAGLLHRERLVACLAAQDVVVVDNDVVATLVLTQGLGAWDQDRRVAVRRRNGDRDARSGIRDEHGRQHDESDKQTQRPFPHLSPLQLSGMPAPRDLWTSVPVPLPAAVFPGRCAHIHGRQPGPKYCETAQAGKSSKPSDALKRPVVCGRGANVANVGRASDEPS